MALAVHEREQTSLKPRPSFRKNAARIGTTISSQDLLRDFGHAESGLLRDASRTSRCGRETLCNSWVVSRLQPCSLPISWAMLPELTRSADWEVTRPSAAPGGRSAVPRRRKAYQQNQQQKIDDRDAAAAAARPLFEAWKLRGRPDRQRILRTGRRSESGGQYTENPVPTQTAACSQPAAYVDSVRSIDWANAEPQSRTTSVLSPAITIRCSLN